MRNNSKPWTVVGLVVIVLAANCMIAWSEAEDPEIFAVLYLGLSAFVGSYTALEGQLQQPTPLMAFGLSVALLTTFGTAISFLLRLSRTGLARISTARRKGGVVIVGSSTEADAIGRSIEGEARKTLIRISEAEPTDERGSISIPNWRSPVDDPLARKTIQAASAVIVAASSDTVSARISAAVRDLSDQDRPFQLVRSGALARALRPNVLTEIPDSEVFHPADNLGQLVASAAVSQIRGSHDSVRLNFKPCADDPTVEAVRQWLVNMSAATKFVRGAPSIEVVSSVGDAEVCVIAGAPEEVAAEAAWESGQRAVIAVVAADLFGSVSLSSRSQVVKFSEWTGGSPLARGEILAIDPERDGLDYQIVIDGLEAQWGRAFHDAYTSLYVATSPGSNSSTWTVGKQGREEQSSIAAAKYMLVVLREHGYELRAGTEPGWGEDEPSSTTVDQMARMEHNEWWKRRTWVSQEGVERRVSLRMSDSGSWREGPNCVPFDELDKITQDYNRDVIARVYPALAAMFGYGIRKGYYSTFS